MNSTGGSSQATNTTIASGSPTDYVLYMYVIRQTPLNSTELSSSSAYVPWESSATNEAGHPVGQPLETSPSIESPLGQAMEEETEHLSSESASMEWQPGLVLVATGPLPSRTAAPLGGVLASGDPVPLVDHRDAALIDLALLDLMGARPSSNEEEAVSTYLDAHDSSNRDIEDVGLALAGRGLGGLPLLGSSMTDMVRSSRKSELPNIDEDESTDKDMKSPLQPDTAFVGSSVDRLATDPVTESASRPQPPTHNKRIAALAGASIVAAFTAGLILPEFAGQRTRGARTWFRIRRYFRGSRPAGGPPR